MGMKHIFKQIILFATLCVLALSCNKPADHSIRVKNDSSSPIGTITVGALTFKDIKAKTATEYLAIPEGTYSVGGDISTNEFTISGKGTHKWSITIKDGNSETNPLEITLEEDK